jgi:1,3-beta-glucanosyltransferase GAS1
MSAIYGSQMTPTLSGAFVYEWIQEENDYGIIEYPDITLQDNLNVSVGSPVPMQPEFGNLMSQWAANTPTGVSLAGYSPSSTGMGCPETTKGTWDIAGSVVLPDTPTQESPSPTISGTPHPSLSPPFPPPSVYTNVRFIWWIRIV